MHIFWANEVPESFSKAAAASFPPPLLSQQMNIGREREREGEKYLNGEEKEEGVEQKRRCDGK